MSQTEFELLALKVWQALTDTGSSIEAAKPIQEFFKAHEEDHCEDCERIDTSEAYQHVMENPPEPMYTIMTVRQLRSLKDVDEMAKVLLWRATE